MTDVLVANKEVATGFLDMAFNQRQVEMAVRTYLADTYTQHNPHAADGAQGAVEALTGFVGQFPELRLDIRRIIAEGEFVVTHSLMVLARGDRGSVIADIFRVRDGRIVEHWDVAQEIPENSANDNTML